MSQMISTKIEFLFFLIKSLNIFLTISPYTGTNISLKQWRVAIFLWCIFEKTLNKISKNTQVPSFSCLFLQLVVVKSEKTFEFQKYIF